MVVAHGSVAHKKGQGLVVVAEAAAWLVCTGDNAQAKTLI